MTYPPTNPGYPAPQQTGGYGGPVGPSYPAPAPVAAPGPSKTPVYLTVAVLVLGLAAYLASFGPLLSINTDIGPFGGAEFTASGLSYWTVAALLASLLAAASLLPKSRNYVAIIAVTAVLGLLLVIGQVVNRPSGFSVGWALWLVLAFTLLQAVAATGALLLDAGAISAPAPRPRYEPYGQYGPPQQGYYGQPGQPGQRPGYPTPYPGGYPAGAAAGPDTSAPDTPPTGFPSYQPPPSTATTQPPAEPSPGSTPS